MQVFGLEPIAATLLFTSIGLVLQNVVAWLKDAEAFNIRKSAASGIIAFFGSSIVVGGIVGGIPDTVDPLVMYTTIAGAIAVVAGFDTLIKNGAKAITKARE